jgi:predicted nucleic acid-binding Zn ribbon protein
MADEHSFSQPGHSDADMDRYGAILTAIGEVKSETAGMRGEVKGKIETIESNITWIKENLEACQKNCSDQCEKVAICNKSMDKRVTNIERYFWLALIIITIIGFILQGLVLPLLVEFIKVKYGMT